MTKSEYQKIAIAFKNEHDLTFAIPGRLIAHLEKDIVDNLFIIDTILATMLKGRVKNSHKIVKTFYETLIYMDKDSRYAFLAQKINAYNYLIKEYNKIKNDNVVSFVVEETNSYVERGLTNDQKIAHIKAKYARLGDFLSKNLPSPTFSLETQREKNGQYQIHAHGFCSKEDYAILEDACKKAGFIACSRTFKGKISNFVSYMLKDQTVSKMNNMSAYKKMGDINSVKILAATFKYKYAYYPKTLCKIAAFLMTLVSKKVRKLLTTRFKVNFVKIMQNFAKKLVEVKRFTAIPMTT